MPVNGQEFTAVLALVSNVQMQINTLQSQLFYILLAIIGNLAATILALVASVRKRKNGA